MEDKPFKEITLMTRQLGKMKVITSIMQAAEFIVNEWPGTDTERLDIAKLALLECYDGTLSPGIVAWLSSLTQSEGSRHLRRGSWSPAVNRETGEVGNGKMRRRARESSWTL